jgi:hypothetical protein
VFENKVVQVRVEFILAKRQTEGTHVTSAALVWHNLSQVHDSLITAQNKSKQTIQLRF